MDATRVILQFQKLPTIVQNQLSEYMEYLANKYSKKGKNKKQFKFDWKDGLIELKDHTTSVDLQHQANQLR